MPKKNSKRWPQIKNARKQTHTKIQFYVRTCVTTVKKIILLYSTCPTEHAIDRAEEDHDADAANDGNEPSTGADDIACADTD